MPTVRGTLLQSILIPERVAPGASWKETTILGKFVTISGWGCPGFAFRRLKFERGSDSGFATFKGHPATGTDELHAFGYLDRGGDDVGILLGACKLDGRAFLARCGQSVLNRLCIVGTAVSFWRRGRERPIRRLSERKGRDKKC